MATVPDDRCTPGTAAPRTRFDAAGGPDRHRTARAPRPRPGRRPVAGAGRGAAAAGGNPVEHSGFASWAAPAPGRPVVVNTSATLAAELDGDPEPPAGRWCCTSRPGRRTRRTRGWWSCAPHRTAPGRCWTPARQRCSGWPAAAGPAAARLTAGRRWRCCGRAPGCGWPRWTGRVGARSTWPGTAARSGTTTCDRDWPIAAYQTVFATVPGSAEMPSAARPFTRRLVDRAGRPGRRDRADHPAHRRVLAGGAREALRGVVRGARRPPRGWSSHAAGRRPGDRGRHNGGPSAGVGGRRRTARSTRRRAGPSWSSPRTAGPRGRRPDHRLARARRPRTC